MKTLYIIGNGFDIHHRLKTAYKYFAYYLQDNYSNLHDYLVNYFSLPYLDREIVEYGGDNEKEEEKRKEALWWEFEKALANLDFETILDENTDYLPDLASDNFRDRDLHSYQFEMELIVKDLTVKMRAAFKEFISKIHFPDDNSDKLVRLEPNAIFFNFNYTDTLERYYGIKVNRILYIHNKANSKEELILGHGVKPENLRNPDPEPPSGLSEEELHWWHEKQSDSYDYSFEQGKKELLSYFYSSFKPTSDIIQQNKNFLDSLKDIEQVFVLGHSLALVDSAYFEEIINSIAKSIPWYVSWYGYYEKQEKTEALLQMGLHESQIHLIQINDLIPKQPTLFQ